MADTVVKPGLSSTKPTSPDNAGPIIEESQESEEYQQDLQVVLGTAFGVIAVVGLIALGLLLYRLYRVRSGNLSYNQNDDLNLFERDLSLDVADKSEAYASQPTVLVLYAQDCPIHERMVAALANFLMEACGCVVSLDLLEEAELGQRGLEDWLIERLQEADYILTVCSLGARLRCSKKHLRFQKWSTQVTGKGGRGPAGDGSLSSSPTLKKLKDERNNEQGPNDEVKHRERGDDKFKEMSDQDNLIMSLSGAITDYFAIAVDYVAEKMRVEQQKGLGLTKFINVYFDYSARSDIPPQLEVAAEYCLMRDLKQLRQHLMGSRPNTSQNHTTEREEGIMLVGDGSEKSEEGEGTHCDILETETGMLLRATLEQAKAFFQDNPTWMEEQMDRACPLSPHSQPTHSTSYFRGGKGKKWRRRRGHHSYEQEEDGKGRKKKVHSARGSVKEPLLGVHSRGEIEGSLISASSSMLSPRSLQQKLQPDRLVATKGIKNGLHLDSVHQSLHWPNQDNEEHHDPAGTVIGKSRNRLRNTLPRSGKTLGEITGVGSESLEGSGWVSNERSLGFGMDSPTPQGIFLSRQNSLPSSLASSRTPEVSAVIDADGRGSAAPSPSSLQPTSKLSCMSKSADSFVMNRDLREWHPMDQERLPCLYCNGTQLDRGCIRCRPGHLGNMKGLPDCDIDPGFSSSAEGVPVLLHSSCRNNSKSQTTILQAEVHQEWRMGQDSSIHMPDSSSNAVQRVWNSSLILTKTGNATDQTNTLVQVQNKQQPTESFGGWHSKSGQELPGSERHGNQTHGNGSPGMRRWVSGIVQSPRQWLAADEFKRHSNSMNQPVSFQYHHHRTLSGGSSLSSHEDSASISSSDSVSDGDSLERDLRSIEKISSFHDFVVSSSFVDSHGMTFVCPGSFPPSQPSLKLLSSVSAPPHLSHNV